MSGSQNQSNDRTRINLGHLVSWPQFNLVVLIQDELAPPPEVVWPCLETFGVVTSMEGGATGIQWVEA